ncbi:MAG: hypothetical protein GF334_00985, partial [Candidatus Altiarchaeales archaeon]|nr:hypothetical protein [Candidatus Altiarchaeales archaeon]
SKVKQENLAQLACELKRAGEKLGTRLVLVHGAGPFGHVLAEEYDLKSKLSGPRQIKGFARTHRSMQDLNLLVLDSLLDAGINCAPIQPSCMGVLDDGRISRFNFRVCGDLLDAGLTPVGFGDVLVDLKKGINILSGDQLACFLAGKLGAKRCVFVTDYNGLYEGEPGKSEKLDVVGRGDLDRLSLDMTHSTDVTGGIAGKVREVMDLASAGVSCEIISAEENNLFKALSGEKVVGTRIVG